MPSPPIQVFLTTIASQPALRQRQEYVLRVLQVKKVPFTSYDLASDEEAKKLWRRKAPADKQQLPGILIGGELPGTFQDFEEAVEFGELNAYLRLNEVWEPLEGDKPMLRAVPVGIPGAYSPAQMNPSHVSPAPSPIRTSKPRDGELDAGEKLGDAGLVGVNVTEDDLLALVEELGLNEDEANELVKGLGPAPSNSKKEEATKDEVKKVELMKDVVKEMVVKKAEAKKPEVKKSEVKTTEAENVETKEEKVEPVEAKEEKAEPVETPKAEATPEVKANEADAAEKGDEKSTTEEVKAA
ncbi:uncharacterized protein TRAVEDRAFT_158537 [Trametes versicolor FP-101664 SS1]|uniref:uncharacterized protein n=1 Tax=Trametes versicolor (strain FP-101664) TaxID=717944 RepID=UPI0004623B10|nr:uncharacterized protein TRAVEDRAFT_158537 [Trametes versicolor FP-101664 SS1]EIW64362.1 hypothetical protein TRAVEDRAFT_158537 [Trametes versicolor FP-101664 SS1]